MFRTTLEKKDGTKFDAIATTKFNYEKDYKWLYAHGFRYTNAAYNQKARGVAQAMFHVNEQLFAEKFPEEYKVICKRDGIKPITAKKAKAPKAETKKAEAKKADEPTMAEVLETIKALKKENATLKAQLTKAKKAASK